MEGGDGRDKTTPQNPEVNINTRSKHTVSLRDGDKALWTESSLVDEDFVT